MTLNRRIAIVRCLLVAALIGCGYCAARASMIVYFLRQTNDVSMFRPATAEDVGRQAARFQNGTPEVDGVFRIVQRQHGDLRLMFDRLETAADMGWALAVSSAAILVLLSGVLAASLALVVGIERRLPRPMPGAPGA